MNYLRRYSVVLDWVSNNTNTLSLGAVFLSVTCDEFLFILPQNIDLKQQI